MKKVVLILCMAASVFPGAALGQQLREDSAASIRPVAKVSTGEAIVLKDRPGLSNSADSSRLTTKFRYFEQHSVKSGAFVGALFTAGAEMAKSPAQYPRQWRCGASGFGRLYGDAFAFQTAAQSGRFVAAVAFHEDPSYSKSTSLNPFARAAHAIVFTAFDKSDSGHIIPAFSNFAGAASAGFVGSAYLPRGYNDPSHALDRTAIAFAGFAVTNLLSEFGPELRSVEKKLHFPQFVLGTPSN